MIITIKTVFGLEEVLKDELADLGYEKATVLNRAVQIDGSWDDVYKLNVHLRCAISILVQLKVFKINKEQDIYDQARTMNWPALFDLNKTFAVKGAVFSDLFRHTQYPFLLVKDAIVDSFREATGDRPNVDIKTPQVMFDVYVNNREVTISLNSSGAPLYQRGYREAVGLAPLNEVVAAGLLKLSGWDMKTDLYDPFCGSGTILIEAAMMAANIPANYERTHYAFKNLKNYKPEVFDAIIDSIPRRITELPCKIEGSDQSAEMVTKTRRNLRGLPIGRFVNVSVEDFDKVKKPSEKGIVITNPPYGERMGDEIEEMYEEIGNWMKTEMTGYECWLLSSNMEAFKKVGLKPSKKLRIFNGKLECSFRNYSIYEGSKKAKYQD